MSGRSFNRAPFRLRRVEEEEEVEGDASDWMDLANHLQAFPGVDSTYLAYARWMAARLQVPNENPDDRGAAADEHSLSSTMTMLAEDDEVIQPVVSHGTAEVSTEDLRKQVEKKKHVKRPPGVGAARQHYDEAGSSKSSNGKGTKYSRRRN